MPLYLLQVKCDLENINKLYYDNQTFWKFNIKSPDGEERQGITVNVNEELELSGSKGCNEITYFSSIC